MNNLFDLVSNNKNNLSQFFESREWTSIDLDTRLKALERFFNTYSWSSTRKDIFLEIIREIENIVSRIDSRPRMNVIPSYKINNGIYTDYSNIFINFDKLIYNKTSYVEALYLLKHEHIRLRDYYNVINGKNDMRTNEIRLNLATPKLYFARNFNISLEQYLHNMSLRDYHNSFLFHNYQPIEYYAYPEAFREASDVFDHIDPFDQNYRWFKRGQDRFERIIANELKRDNMTREDVKKRVIDAAIYYIMTRDEKTKDEVLQSYYVTGYIPQFIKK